MKNLLLLCLAAALASCSSDNSGTTGENNPSGKKLKQTVAHLEIDGKTETTDYTYDADGQLSQIQLNSNQEGIGFQVTTFQYASGKIIRTEHEVAGMMVIVDDYVYNSNRIVKSLESYNGAVYTTNYTYTDGKVSKSEQYVNGTLIDTRNYTYDEHGNRMQSGVISYDHKRNPYWDIYPPAYRLVRGIGPNNVLEIENGVYTYQYNADGLPVSSNLSDSGSGIQTTSFSYN